MTELHNKKVFNEQIRPLMDEIVRLCGRYKIPCFMTFAIENDDNGTKYINNGILTKARRIELTDDKIKDHLLVQSGFKAKPDFSDIDGFIETDVIRLKKMVDMYKQTLAQEEASNCYGSVRSRIRHLQNRDADNDYSTEYQKQHLEEQRARNNKYYKKNAEQVKARQHEYYMKHRKTRLEQKKAYYQANKDKILAKKKAYREKKKNEDNGE